MMVGRTVLALLGLLLAAACSTTASSADADGTLRAVSNFLHPPFSSRDASGRAVGIEIDLIDEAARRLGREVEWSERSFGDLLPAVADGEADIAASTIGITAERAKRVAFTKPYFSTTIVALVREGEGEPQSLEDLSGRRIGTERATTAVPAAKERLPQAERVTERREGRTWAQMLSDGEIDAVVLDHSHAGKFMDDAGVRFRVLDEPLREEPFALAVHPDAQELLQVLDQVIADREAGR